MDRAPKQVATVTLHPRAGEGALAARLRREIRGTTTPMGSIW